MGKRILWLDNDRVFLRPVIEVMRLEGFDVIQVYSLSEAMEELDNTGMLILDVMMPVREDESHILNVDETQGGQATGLCFYRKYKVRLEELKVQVVVCTIRESIELRKEFEEAGLPPERFIFKSEIADIECFLANSVFDQCRPESAPPKEDPIAAVLRRRLKSNGSRQERRS